jgi:hypothetical protein
MVGPSAMAFGARPGRLGFVNPCPAKMSFIPTGSAIYKAGFAALRALVEGPGGGDLSQPLSLSWPVSAVFFTASVVIPQADVEGRGKGGVIISYTPTHRGGRTCTDKKVLNLHFL